MSATWAGAAVGEVAHEWLTVRRCPASERAPTIDGRLDDQCWDQGVRTGAFVTPQDEPTELWTAARIAHDGESLYVGVQCREPHPDQLLTEHTERDSDVYLDDCVEVFLDTDLDFRTYYHFLVNAANVQRDESRAMGGKTPEDVAWNAGWRSAVAVGGPGWSVEMAIPFSEVGLELGRDTAVGLNICRSAPRIDELSCWVPTHGGFHNPHRNATVLLGARRECPRVHLEIPSVGELLPDGRNELEVRLDNRDASRLTLEGELRVGTNEALRREEVRLGELPPGESMQRTAQYRISGSGASNLCLLVREATTGSLVAARTLTFTVPILLAQDFGSRLPAPEYCQSWWARSLYKISPQRAVPEREEGFATLECARNEYESLQLVLRPKEELRDVQVRLTPLRGVPGVIGEHNLDLYRVEYVEVRQPSDAFGSTGLYPDPLVAVDGSLDLPADRNTVLWVTVRVPPGTPAGQYRGALQVEPPGREAFELPIRLRVLDFTLTDETHTRTAYGLRPHWDVLGLQTVDQKREVYLKYMRAMWRHRLSPYDPFMFDGIRWSIDGPRWRLKTGGLELVCDTFSDTYFSFARDSELLGRLTNTITQFEREGVGYQGTGVGWPGINALKDVRIIESGPDGWVMEITGARLGGGPAHRAYETTFRFAIAAGRPAVAARMVRFKNTSEVRYQLRGYYYILEPAAEDAQKIKTPRCAGWLSADGRMIAGLTTAEKLVGNPPKSFYSRKEVWLEPGEEVEGFGPIRVFFAGDAASEEQMLSVASELRESLAADQPAVEGARIEADVRERVEISHDFSEFDAAAERYLDEWKFTSFRLPCMPGHLAGHGRFTPEYRRLHRRVFGPIVEHLRERGWLEKAYAYWFDEPHEEEYAYVAEGMDVLAESCPGLKRLLTEQVEEPLVGHVDLWVPLLSRFDPEVCRQRQEAGDEVWWYVCCGPRAPYPNNFIDHPAINHRIRFWMMDKYNVEGSLYWQTTSWRRNPWENVAAVDPSGERFHGNGDGFFMYPACRQPSDEPVLAGPVITLRLETLRDGLEDLEYIWTLKRLIARGEDRLARLQGEQRQRLAGLLSQARAALAAPDRLAESPTHYAKDPRHLLRERARLADAIVDLRQVLPGE
ncbi:MAG: DUF4091 domain-containing protein [Armatimonadota bacterium]|nr:DUF4091 domain-containing protein [Armatimonadota bacterium]